MKILIITFNSGVNPGTFMQALGVQTAIKKIWPDAIVDYLKFPSFKTNYKKRDKSISILKTFKQKMTSACRLYRYNKLRSKTMNFTHQIDLFKYNDEDIRYIHNYDLIVIGSDTILEKAYDEEGNIGLNWMPLEVKKIFFAASASPANFEPNYNLGEVASKAVYIGLRDNLTINYFEKKLGLDSKDIYKQPDPSYFVNIEPFDVTKHQARKLISKYKYVLCNFGADYPYRKQIADGLRSIGYKTISTQYNPFVDVCFDLVNAYEWAGVFKHIEFSVTERFHDSVFSLRNNKPVIAIDWDPDRFTKGGDSKTFRLLEEYEHSHLHFNLCNNPDISPVIESAKSIKELFDVNVVKRVNVDLYMRNEELLKIIKSKI